MHSGLFVLLFLGGCVAALPVSNTPPRDLNTYHTTTTTTRCSHGVFARAFRGALYPDFVKQVLESVNTDCCEQHAACHEAGRRSIECDDELRACFTKACIRRRGEHGQGSECDAWDEVSWMIT